jgi:hypothetical protein
MYVILARQETEAEGLLSEAGPEQKQILLEK